MNLDDGGRLRINGADVIIDDALHAAQDRFGSVSLAAGTHTIEVTFWGYVADHSLEVLCHRRLLLSLDQQLPSDRGHGRWRPRGDEYLCGEHDRVATSSPVCLRAPTWCASQPVSSVRACPCLAMLPSSMAAPRMIRRMTTAPPPVLTTVSMPPAPGSTGISSAPITLTVGTEPTTAAGETGFMSTEDDAFDANYDLTVDFAMVAVMADYGDYSSFGSASQIANGALRIGISTSAATDSEATNPANTTATGDDTTGTDDEGSDHAHLHCGHDCDSDGSRHRACAGKHQRQCRTSRCLGGLEWRRPRDRHQRNHHTPVCKRCGNHEPELSLSPHRSPPPQARSICASAPVSARRCQPSQAHLV